MNDATRWREAMALSNDDDPHAGGNCLDADELLAAMEGRLEGDRLQRALQATAECPRCAAVAQMAVEVRASAETLAEGLKPGAAIPIGGHPARPRAGRPMPWALAAVLVAGFAIILLLPKRSTSPDMPVRSLAMAGDVEPRTAARMKEAPTRFAWAGMPNARGYRVEIYDDHAEKLWESPLIAETHLEVPESLRIQLQTGTFLWRVRTEGSGVEIGPFHFTVEP